jgi:hypothetical protein
MLRKENKDLKDKINNMDLAGDKMVKDYEKRLEKMKEVSDKNEKYGKDLFNITNERNNLNKKVKKLEDEAEGMKITIENDNIIRILASAFLRKLRESGIEVSNDNDIRPILDVLSEIPIDDGGYNKIFPPRVNEDDGGSDEDGEGEQEVEEEEEEDGAVQEDDEQLKLTITAQRLAFIDDGKTLAERRAAGEAAKVALGRRKEIPGVSQEKIREIDNEIAEVQTAIDDLPADPPPTFAPIVISQEIAANEAIFKRNDATLRQRYNAVWAVIAAFQDLQVNNNENPHLAENDGVNARLATAEEARTAIRDLARAARDQAQIELGTAQGELTAEGVQEAAKPAIEGRITDAQAKVADLQAIVDNVAPPQPPQPPQQEPLQGG